MGTVAQKWDRGRARCNDGSAKPHRGMARLETVTGITPTGGCEMASSLSGHELKSLVSQMVCPHISAANGGIPVCSTADQMLWLTRNRRN